MKPVLAAALICLAAAMPARGEGAAAGRDPEAAAGGIGPLRVFRDWVVGCDNLRNCTALGLAAQDGEAPVYLRIGRDAGPSAQAGLAITVYAEDGGAGMAIGSPLLPKRYRALAHIDYHTAALADGDTQAALDALLPAQGLPVDLTDGERTVRRATISLAGMSAALRFMDAEQGRAGGETAIVAKGPAPASGVPAAGAAPRVRALKIADLTPAPPRPAGIPAGEDGCEDMEDFAVRLAPARVLRGVCAFSGAYNIGYRLYVEEGGGARPLPLDVPAIDAQSPDMSGVLVNAGVEDDGLVLAAFNKGRGLGDCGEESRFAWNGSALELVGYRALGVCRGVAPEDWPVLYRAEVDQGD